jgi:type I restriction-modification system DNA methylase subunit
MVKNNRLAPILNQYKELALGPNQLSGLEMGYIYEELLRRFSEQSGEEAGEHFTPREVIRLMVELLDIPIPDRHLSIYDPASGTGGMLSVAKEHLLERADTPDEKARVEKYVTVHGQELSPTNYAVCQADLLIKNDRQATVHLGNSLIPHEPHSKEPGDQWPETKWRFHRMLSNPPFGVTWGGKDGYEKEARKLAKTRYQAGMPRVNDGALLFLQTMLAKMAPPEAGGSRIAIIFNGSPLSNGDCGSGESEIRRWILENDWLDALSCCPTSSSTTPASSPTSGCCATTSPPPPGPRDAHRRPPAVRERAEVLRQQTPPHHGRPPGLDRRALPRRLGRGLRRRAGQDLPARGLSPTTRSASSSGRPTSTTSPPSSLSPTRRRSPPRT